MFWATTELAAAEIYALANPSGGNPAVVRIDVPAEVLQRMQGEGTLTIHEDPVVPARFPKRLADGSFCVGVTHGVASGIDADRLVVQLSSWLRQWLRANRYWALSGKRSIDFFDDFKGPPHSVTSAGDQVSYCLDGRGTSEWWRDWIALRLAPEVRAAFPEILEVMRISDCASPTEDKL